MSWLAVPKAAVFFALGVLSSAVLVATTHYADAYTFGSQHPQAALSIRWVSTRVDVAARSAVPVASKCASTEDVVSGGYMINGANDGSQVFVLHAYPDRFENGYVVYISNGRSNAITVYSVAGCVPR